MTNIYAALEIGTSRTVLAVGEAETGGRLEVSVHAEIPSVGVRKSQILDIAQAAQSVRSVLREVEKRQAEKGNSLTIGNAFLVVSGQTVKCDRFQGTARISRNKVSDEDIEEVSRAARSMPLPREREILDIFEQHYSVDDLGGIASPKGLAGSILKLDALHVHAETNRINDARTAAGEAHLELRDPLFAATCAAEAVLSDEEKRDGVLALDMGGGSTGYAVYLDGALVHAGAFGVGGDHITNDMATAFQMTQGQAEDIKRREARAVPGETGGELSRVILPGTSALMDERTISRRSLDAVVNARCREMAAMLRERLEELDLAYRLNAGVVLTGGGAALQGIDELMRRELGVETRLGIPRAVSGLETEAHPQAFAAISGALMYAHRNYEKRSTFGNVATIIKGFFK